MVVVILGRFLFFFISNRFWHISFRIAFLQRRRQKLRLNSAFFFNQRKKEMDVKGASLSKRPSILLRLLDVTTDATFRRCSPELATDPFSSGRGPRSAFISLVGTGIGAFEPSTIHTIFTFIRFTKSTRHWDHRTPRLVPPTGWP